MSSISRICGCLITEGFGEYPEKPKICTALLITTSLVVFSILVFKGVIPLSSSDGVWFLGAATLPLICGIVYSVKKEKLNVRVVLESEQLLIRLRKSSEKILNLTHQLCELKTQAEQDRERINIAIQNRKLARNKQLTEAKSSEVVQTTFAQQEESPNTRCTDSKKTTSIIQPLRDVDFPRPTPIPKILFIISIALTFITLILAIVLQTSLGASTSPCTYIAAACLGSSILLAICMPILTYRAQDAISREENQMNAKCYELTQGKSFNDCIVELDSARTQQLADVEELQREMRLEENPKIARDIRGATRRELMNQETK